MFSRAVVLGLTSLAVLGAATPTVASSHRKSPPWISIESPVSPYDPATRGALLLVHAVFREGNPQLSDLTGSAEGIVGGKRRSIPLRFDSTARLNVFGLRRQWPVEGAWLLRISLAQTTAIVTFDQAGNVASARVPTELASGTAIPRAVAAREIDSTLAAAAKR